VSKIKYRTVFTSRRQRLRQSFLLTSLLLAFVASAYYLASPPRAQVASSSIVISQVYGGGGNSGATYKNDFIELFNRGNATINVSGWSVQYASASGSTWAVTTLSGSIPAGGYYLVQEAAGTGGTTNLPPPDATGSTAMSATSAKVALVNTSAALGGACPSPSANIIDFVGYGSTASCSEAGPTGTLSNTTAALRAGNGCTDTDNNSGDFSIGAPTPRNSGSTANPCNGSTNPSGTGSANPSALNPGDGTLLTVAVTPGSNPASTGLAVNGDLTSIGGSMTQQFFDDGTHGDLVASDNTFSFQVTVAANTTNGAKSLSVTITDAQSRTGNTTISLTVGPSNPSGVGAANPSSVSPGGSSLLTVTVTAGGNPASTGLAVAGDLTLIGGGGAQQFFDDGTHGDSIAGDKIFSFLASVPSNTTTGQKVLATTISDAQSRSAPASISLTIQAASVCNGCGVERWSVKTGTDSDAPSIDLSSPTATTISEMRTWATPNPIPSSNRVAPHETTLYVVNATLTLYKLESDSDYHLVMQDGSGNTIVTEIPCPGCVGASSPFAAAIANARAVFDAHYTATGSFQTANVPVQVKGIGMFDFPHGQTGAAPNQIELHPIVDIVFSPCSSISLGATSQSFTASGGLGSVSVSAEASCGWSASSNNPSFITIVSGGSGAGSGTVSYSVAANSSSTNRAGTISIGGQTFTVVEGAQFNDVPVGSQFYNEIGKLSARGVTVGCGGGNYCPNDAVTREQMAAFILRAKGEFNPPTPATQRFDDVPPSNQFYDFIDRLAALNITLGCSTTPPLYCPGNPVTREQMAAFIIRGLGEFDPPTPAMQRFNDVPPENLFYNFIDRMAALGITVGCSATPPLYCPSDSVTRAQMAAFLVRAFDL
jgi:lamin tail-like protein/S-layer family protein